MKRSIVTASLALALSLGGGALFAQEHGGHEAGGFQAPAAPFNLANPAPGMVEVRHGDAVTQEKAPPPFLLGPVANFAILVVLGFMAVRRQINPALAARRAAVETEIAEAKRLHDEAAALHKELSERIANFAAESAALEADLVKQGEAERDRIVAEARARAEKSRAEAETLLAQEMRAMREDLRREAVTAAVAAAEEAVRKGLTPADHSRLVDDFIGALESERASRGASA